MKIGPDQLASKPKKIGDLEGDSVMEVATKGGFHMVLAVKKNGETKTLGTGSNRAVARFIARKENPRLAINQLEKSEDTSYSLLQHQVPDALEMTRRLQALER